MLDPVMYVWSSCLVAGSLTCFCPLPLVSKLLPGAGTGIYVYNAPVGPGVQTQLLSTLSPFANCFIFLGLPVALSALE